MRESRRIRGTFAWLTLGLLLQAAAALAGNHASAVEGAQQEPPAAAPSRVAPAEYQYDAATLTPALTQREREQEDLQPAGQPLATSAAFDQGTVAGGQAAFVRSCTACHDAQRALSKSKSYAGWLTTVQRMAAKDGADIRSSDVVPIATYLASVSGAAGPSTAGGEEAGGWSFGTTVSLLHRSASDEYPVENPGFFPNVWVTASYQSTGPWRATVTACTSCHARDNGAGNAFSLELVEGSATLDLRHLFHGCRCDDGREMLLKAGRFIVPFGAFAAMSHPGIYRTVTNPLMFNMGRRVFVPGSPPQQPVLPQPFADEGIDFIYRTPIHENLTFTLDLYAVNGLQGTGPDIFNRSRAYFDNNEEPSGGARITLGGDFFRLGASVLSGNLADQDLPPVHYTLAGADATCQITDRLRFYFEYAMRRQDSVFAPGTEEIAYGIVTELELRVWDHPNISLLVRYDTLEHRNQTFGDSSLQRVTSGLNIALPGGSLLMINHERWMPASRDDVDLFGVRWVVSL
jgi:mono/diheme cytochrome c family protein